MGRSHRVKSEDELLEEESEKLKASGGEEGVGDDVGANREEEDLSPQRSVPCVFTSFMMFLYCGRAIW